MTGTSQNGRDFHQWNYLKTNQNQPFTLDHSESGFIGLRARKGGKVIHNHGRSKNAGARVTQWGWNSSTHMEYEFRPYNQ